MVVALILLIVFLVIGTSVLTAASTSMSSAAALREKKQLYYFARSVATSFTDGITDLQGTLWIPVKQILEADPDRPNYQCVISARSLSEGGMPDEFLKDVSNELNMDPVAIEFSGVRLDEDGSLRLVGNMTAKFNVHYRGQTYRMTAEYTYQKPEDEYEKTGWTLVKYDQR